MSTVKVTNLQNAGSASVNMTLDTAGNATVANTLAMGSSFLRNRIINGGFVVDQRGGTITSPSGSVAYGVDRWRIVRFNDTTGTFTFQKSGIVPTGQINSGLITVSAAQASVPTTGLYRFEQLIEGYNIGDLAWGTASAQSVTLSFLVRSSVTGTFGGRLVNSAENRSYVFQYTVNSANTWETKSITIPGDTSGTWLADTGIGIGVCFDIGSGTTYEGTANAWNASNVCRASGNVRLINTLSATWYITGVQLEAGSVATPFERRQFGQELALCQRYYTTINDVAFRAYNVAGGALIHTVTLPVKMRASPTLTKVGTWNVTNCAQPTVGSSSGDGTQSFYVASDVTASGEAVFYTSATSQYITASIEL